MELDNGISYLFVGKVSHLYRFSSNLNVFGAFSQVRNKARSFVYLFELMLNVQVNSYCHVMTLPPFYGNPKSASNITTQVSQ